MLYPVVVDGWYNSEMTIYSLTEELAFPSPYMAEPDGLLAVGGDLSVERLVLAYENGIYPWYSDSSPILWWSTDPRLILLPERLRVSRSLRQTINRETFTHSIDRDFEGVIHMCANIHAEGQGGTWITREMQDAYIELHKKGLAHSVESWQGDKLLGGLYGVSLGKAFFGESMFSCASDASKTAFVFLVKRLKNWGFKLIDCQMTTKHLISLGAHEVPRDEFMILLREALESESELAPGRRTGDKPNPQEMWNNWEGPVPREPVPRGPVSNTTGKKGSGSPDVQKEESG
jgi:leucyl/phenylalanyl-tRNA--protein transferase